MNMGMGMGVNPTSGVNPNLGGSMSGMNMNPNLGGMNVMNPAINQTFGVGPALNSHVGPGPNPNLNVIQRISLLIKSQLPYLQAIMMNVRVSKKEDRNHSR